MPILLLIRHATNDFVKTGRLPGQTPNIHLNEEGRTQADALGRHLAKQPITAVYASHLERAIETAWRVAAPHGLSIVVRPALADMNTGDFTGKLVNELNETPESRDIWKTIVEKPSEGRMPNGESMLDLQRRVIGALDRLCAEYPDPEPPKDEASKPESRPDAKDMPKPAMLAVVMHADPIKIALAHYLGMPFDNFQRLMVAPASISAVLVNPKHIAVLNVNHTVPVPEPAP